VINIIKGCCRASLFWRVQTKPSTKNTIFSQIQRTLETFLEKKLAHIYLLGNGGVHHDSPLNPWISIGISTVVFDDFLSVSGWNHLRMERIRLSKRYAESDGKESIGSNETSRFRRRTNDLEIEEVFLICT
jgi:hypothetical protein